MRQGSGDNYPARLGSVRVGWLGRFIVSIKNPDSTHENPARHDLKKSGGKKRSVWQH